jgi:glycosyltransferase involved in cell wall biosynthesis
MAGRRVAIVTVSYNTRELTAMLLWSIRRVLHWENQEILVVDNASTDGSRELLTEVRDAGLCTLVVNDSNIGHGAALNQAVDQLARTSSAERIWIVDSDCVVARPDAIASVFGRCPHASIVGEPQWDRWHARDRFGLYSLLVDPEVLQSLDGARFTHDGDPAFAVLDSAERAGISLAPFPFMAEGFLIHRGRGSLAAVAAAGERDHPLYDWAVEHHEPHYGGVPGAPERYAALTEQFRGEVGSLLGRGLIAAMAGVR